MKYLLDTNICIELIRKKSDKLVKQLTDLRVGDVGVSTITVAELQFGALKSRDPEQNLLALEQFLFPLAIADFGYDAAAAYGQLRAQLERKGMSIGSMDLLIAAHALSLDLTLVTNNTKEFARVPNLSLEDWVRN